MTTIAMTPHVESEAERLAALDLLDAAVRAAAKTDAPRYLKDAAARYAAVQASQART